MTGSPYLPGTTDPDDWEDTFRRYVEATVQPRPLGPDSHTSHTAVTLDDGRTLRLPTYQ